MIINKVGNQVHLLQTWYSHINQGRFFSSFPLNRADCTQEDPKENQVAKLSPNSSIVFAWLNNLILWTELTLLSSSRQWSQSNMGRENTQVGPQFVIRCGPALVGPLCCGSEVRRGSGDSLNYVSTSASAVFTRPNLLKYFTHAMLHLLLFIRNQRLLINSLRKRKPMKIIFSCSVKMTWKKLWGVFVLRRIIICRSMTIILTEIR